MTRKSNVWVLLVCGILAVSILATAGLAMADGVNVEVSLGQEKSGTLTAAGKIDNYYFTLGTGYTKLTLQTYTITGTNDFDLYIKRGAYPTTSSYDARAYTSSSTETISITSPASGTYYAMVYSYSGSGTYKFKATGEGGTTEQSITLDGAGVASSVSATGDKKYFSVVVPSGKTALRVETYNPSAGFDLDLYLKLGAQPTTSTYDGRGYTSSSSEVITLTNPSAGTYYIMVYSYSGSGTFSVKATSTGTADTTAPTISGMTATSITSSGATVTWTTNEASSSVVEYGTTTSYGSTATGSSGVTSHSVALSGLAANTNYYYRVKSADAAGNTATSTGSSFTTLSAADTTPPTISGVSASSITSTGATVTWTTNEASSSVVEYGTTTSYGSTATGSSGVTSHNVALSGLTASKLYYYRVKSADAAGNTATSAGSSFTTLAGATGTVAITLDGAGAASSVSATADKKYFSVIVPSGKATLKVETYNPSAGFDLDLYVKLGALPTTSSYDGRGYTSSSSEVITITNPAAGTYYIMAYSYSGSGTFSVKATSTTSTTDTTPPTISGVAVSSITETGATVTWTTNEASTSVAEYGTTTSYGTSKTGTSGVTSHSVALTGLAASTVYYYRVKSADAAGNTATGTGSSFTTAGSTSSTVLTLDGSGISSSVSATADKKYFTVVVPTGKATLTVETYNTGTGYDIDLYVKLGSQPTTSVYDARGYTSSSNEVATINSPAAGTYHIMVLSYSGAGAFSVKATSTASGGGGDGTKLALCIGISDYKTINDLTYADDDAQVWSTYLRGKGYTVTTLINSQASESAIYSAVSTLVANAVAGTKVVITFSGHGGFQSEGGYSTSAGTTYGGQKDSHPSLMFAWDASGSGAGCLLDNVFSYNLRNLNSGAELFVFMDECRSGGMDEVAYHYTGSGYDTANKIYVAQGCAWNEYTYDASQYSMGAWTYWFCKWAIQSQGATTMESAFSLAAPKYTSDYSDSHPEAVDNFPGSYTL